MAIKNKLLKTVAYYVNNNFKTRQCIPNTQCLTSEIVKEMLGDIKTDNMFTYIVFSIGYFNEQLDVGHHNTVIYEYNSVKKELCSVYYEPHGHSKISNVHTTIRKELDTAMSSHFSCDLISLPFEHYLQSSGLQTELEDDIGFCVAVSNLRLYAILNIIYSRSFNVQAKKTKKQQESKSNIVMGNKKLLSSREKYLEKVKIQRREFLDSDFNTVSMCEWIQDVDKHIIKYYNRKPNILYNFLFMIAQYIMVNVGVKVPIAMQEGDMGSDSDENEDDIKYNTEDNFQEIFNKSVKILMKTDDLKKAIRHLEAIPRAYVTPYMMNLTFLHNALSHDYLTPVKLKRKNEKCRYDCEGNLECIDYKCKDME
jgi:hypothetical protein